MSNDGTLTQTHTETRETRESRANGHGAERTTALVEVHTENGAAGCWPESSCVRIAFAWKMRIFELIGESQSSTLLEKHTQMKINKFRPALCWGERARHRKASGFGCGVGGGCGVCVMRGRSQLKLCFPSRARMRRISHSADRVFSMNAEGGWGRLCLRVRDDNDGRCLHQR